MVVTTSEPLTDVRLRYGATADALPYAASVSQDGATLKLLFEHLEPSMTYLFSMESVDSSHKQSIYMGQIATSGFPVTVTLKAASTGLSNREVKINDVSYYTDNSGMIRLNLEPGSYTIVDPQTGTSQNIDVARVAVAEDGTIMNQDYTMELAAVKRAIQAGPSKWIVTFSIVLCIVLAVFGLRWIRRRVYRTVFADGGADDAMAYGLDGYPATQPPAQDAILPSVAQLVDPTPMPAQPVSLADMFAPQRKPKPQAYDPFLQDSPFAKGRDLDPLVAERLQATQQTRQPAGKHHKA